MEGQLAPTYFGEWLKRRRKSLDMTQDELAKCAGCSVGALRKIESGERKPSKQLAVLLSKALDISSDDLPTFLRAARGELNVERIKPSLLEQPAFEQASPQPPPLSRIPIPATPLIGREAEVAALERIFADQQCRLLTLTGTGGIGKTRLALEFAARNKHAFPGGIFYIPLTSVQSSEKIIPAVADVLDFGFSGPGDPKEQLFNYISACIRANALIVLDNLEHLLVQSPTEVGEPGVVVLVSEFLQRLPNVYILGTSRERLRLQGEWTYELHGLSVPPADFWGQLDAYNSVALFIRSARRINPGFQLVPEEQPYLIRICQLVDGVPLAIELAAAWTAILSCREIAGEIQSNMDFLTSSMRDVPERHRSIRATFDHSWRLLTDEERRVLCQLSVFHGGFDRQAAYQVAAAPLPVLVSLSDKSLVRRTGTERFDLHEVIRQYAASHLNDHPQFLVVCERHSEYYLDLLAECETALKSAAQQETVRRLSGEIDNLRAAWTWAVNHRKYEPLIRAGRAFGWYFEVVGLYQEGIEQLELLVQELKVDPMDREVQRGLGLAFIHQALLYFRTGRFARARELYEGSLPILRPTRDQALLADALIYAGTIAHLCGEYDRGRALLKEGLELARASGQPWFEAYAIDNLGYIESLLGRYEQGYEQMMAAISIWRTVGDPHVIALGLNFIVPTLLKLGHSKEAKAFMHESIELCERSKNRWGLGTAYSYLGLACLAEGEFAAAKTHLLKSLEIFREYITGWNIARSLTFLGEAYRLGGEAAEARSTYLEALHSALECNSIPIALESLAGLAELQAQMGKPESALSLCSYIMNHPCSEQEAKSRAGHLCAKLEQEFTTSEIAAARELTVGKSIQEIAAILDSIDLLSESI